MREISIFQGFVLFTCSYDDFHPCCFHSQWGENIDIFGQNIHPWKSENDFPFLPSTRPHCAISSPKFFWSQWITITLKDNAFDQVGCKLKYDNFPLMHLVIMWVHYIMSLGPWSISTRIFEIFFSYSFFCLFLLTLFFFSLSLSLILPFLLLELCTFESLSSQAR